MTDTINIPRAELQAALDALQECRQKIAYLLGNIEWYEPAQAIDFADISIKAISARLAIDVCSKKRPDVEKAAQIVEKSAQQEEKAADPCVDGSCDCCWADKEPEPVAWMHTTATGETYFRKKPHDKVFNPKPVYTTLPKREWQGLTDDEIHRAYQTWFNSESKHERDFVRAIEAKLREKNK